MHHSKESIKFDHRSYSIKFHPPKKIGSHLVTPLLKQFEKKRKGVKTFFSQSYPKIIPFFPPVSLGFPGMLILRKKLLRSNIPRLKKKVVLCEFWSLGVICIFSSETLSWCFTSFLGQHCMNA